MLYYIMRQHPDEWESRYRSWKEAKKEKEIKEGNVAEDDQNIAEKMRQYELMQKAEEERVKNLHAYDVPEVMDSRRSALLYIAIFLVVLLVLYFIFRKYW